MIGHRIVATQPVAGELYAIMACPSEAWVVPVIALAIVEEVHLTAEGDIHPDTPPADYRERTLEPVIIHDSALCTPHDLTLYEATIDLLPPGTIDVDADQLEEARKHAASVIAARQATR